MNNKTIKVINEINEIKSNQNPIKVTIKPAVMKEYFCAITEYLDKFQYAYTEYADIFNYRMKTYIMPPDKNYDDWYIAIRVPGATRGYIKVIPNSNYWEVIEVKLYNDTAIIGENKLGCYYANVKYILDSFNGLLIDFDEYNPDKLNSNDMEEN